jgi:hypothetical protein
MCTPANVGLLRSGFVVGMFGLVAVTFALLDASTIGGLLARTGNSGPVLMSSTATRPIHRSTGLQAILHPNASNRTLATPSSRDTCPGLASGGCVIRAGGGAWGDGLLLRYARLYLLNAASAARGYPSDPSYGAIMAAPPIRMRGSVGPEYWVPGGQLLPEHGGLDATPEAPLP